MNSETNQKINLRKFKNLLISGSSFSANAISGAPPTDSHDGGCSFIDNGRGSHNEPESWAGMLSQQLEVTSLVNVAAAGHGNFYISNSILEMLSRYNYNPDDTLILFNVTYLHRYDIACPFNHPDSSDQVPWSAKLIPYTYINVNSSLQKSFVKNISIEVVEQLSVNALRYLFNFLENRKFTFYFLLDDNHTDHPLFQTLLEDFSKNWIKFSPGISMQHYCKSFDNFSNSHPTIEGYEKISYYVYDYLSKNLR